MTTILTKIRTDLKTAMTREVEFRKDEVSSGPMYEVCIAQKNVSRAIISMYPSIGVKPDNATDNDTLKLLKKYINTEKMRELFVQKHLKEADVKDLPPSQFNQIMKEEMNRLGDDLTSMNISIAKSYLPKTATITTEELAIWIRENIDFSVFKNRMQAMKPIMTNFKGIDGNMVKNVLLAIDEI